MPSDRLTRTIGAYTGLLLVVEAVGLVAGHRFPEGTILVTFSADHGLTTSDLAGIALALFAVAVFYVVVFGREDGRP